MRSITINMIFLLSLIFSGCRSGAPVTESSLTSSLNQEFALLEKDFNSALANQVDLLSSQNFKAAHKFYIDAKKSLNNPVKKGETLQLITNARSYLYLAREEAKMAYTKVKDIIVARQLAVKAGAAIYYPSRIERADTILNRLSSKEQLSTAEELEKKFSTLKDIYSRLEMAAIKHHHLNEAKMTIAMAIKEGARRFVPLNLSEAVRNYRETSAYIESNPHDFEEIKRLSQEANQSAFLLLQSTKEALAMYEDKISTRQSAVK